MFVPGKNFYRSCTRGYLLYKPYILFSKRKTIFFSFHQNGWKSVEYCCRFWRIRKWCPWWYPVTFLGHRSQRLQWPIVITRCPASVVRRPLDYLHFRLLLQNCLMDFDETWYGWSTQGPLQVLLFFGQICPGADPGRGKNRSRGVPFFRKLLQTGRLQRQTECIAVI